MTRGRFGGAGPGSVAGGPAAAGEGQCSRAEDDRRGAGGDEECGADPAPAGAVAPGACRGVRLDGRRAVVPERVRNVVAVSSYSRVWKRARELALLPGQVTSVMAARPYDLRHAGVSQWLNSGVPAPEVAARAGHSVDVLLKIYAKCIDGQEAEMNDRIMQGLGDAGPSQ